MPLVAPFGFVGCGLYGYLLRTPHKPVMCKVLRYLTEGPRHAWIPPCWKNNTLRLADFTSVQRYRTVAQPHQSRASCFRRCTLWLPASKRGMKPGQMALKHLVGSWLR